MTEVKTYQKEGRTYTVYGGQRNTTYDDFTQVIKRMKNLAKKGKKLTWGKYDLVLDRFVFGMTGSDCVWENIKTPGYQKTEFNPNYGKPVIAMIMAYVGYEYCYRMVEVA